MKMNKTSYLKVAIRSAVSLSLFFILFLLFGAFFFKNGLSSDLIGGCLFMCIVSLDKSTFEKWICPQNMQVLLVVMNLKRMLIPFLLEKKKRTPKLVSNF